MRDQIYCTRRDRVEPFRFDHDVAAVFDDMAARSIPYYAEVQRLTIKLVERYYVQGGLIYDIGCATGNTVLALLETLPSPPRIRAIDNSAAMIECVRHRVEAAAFEDDVSFECRNVEDVSIYGANVVISHYTLHFLPLEHRAETIVKIFEGMRPGGAFILSEKVTECDADLTDCFSENYHDLKRRNGYSPLEIEQKVKALDGVLVPLSVNQNLNMLRRCGFTTVSIFFKWLNFASFIALKV